MGEHDQSDEWGEAAGLNGRLAWKDGNRKDNRPRADRESPSTGIWRRPGAGAVPTRPVEAFFDFSTREIHDPAEAGPRLNSPDDELLEGARNRAFALLDDWLTWVSVMDDESVFARAEFMGPRARYAFVVDEILANPVDVVRYSGKTSPFF